MNNSNEPLIWGTTKENKVAKLYTLKNKYIEMEVSDYGCTITKLLVPDKNGKIDDIVLGCQTLQEYEDFSPSFGCVIGRTASRIIKFTINEQEITLNNFHGGKKNFSKQIFEANLINSDKNEPGICFKYLSKDGEENYPGDLSVTVIYTLLDENALKITYYSTVEGSPTIINLTNHSYFNLG